MMVPRDPILITTEALHTTTLPKNIQFNNMPTHKYNLCSQQNIIHHVYSTYTEDKITQYVYNQNYSINYIYDDNRKNETIDSLLSSKNKHIWQCSLSNEWGCLAQGNDAGINGTDTIVFIP